MTTDEPIIDLAEFFPPETYRTLPPEWDGDIRKLLMENAIKDIQTTVDDDFMQMVQRLVPQAPRLTGGADWGSSELFRAGQQAPPVAVDEASTPYGANPARAQAMMMAIRNQQIVQDRIEFHREYQGMPMP